MTTTGLRAGEAVYRLRGTVDGGERIFDLAPGEHRVGSARTNDVRLRVEGISREHAILTVTATGLLVEDCGSKNGTFIGEDRVERAGVDAGAELRFGPARLRVEALDADARLAIRFETPEPSQTSFEVSKTPLVAAEDVPKARSTVVPELVFPQGYWPGTSSAMVELYERMCASRRGRLSVLIHGETGVGKELIARILHDSSDRADGPFVAVNCAAIPKDLLEAEMFGVGKGVATGVEMRTGTFQRAEGGTLFLDEIGELAPVLQPKLLRALQEKEIQPVGGQPRKIDVRVLAATNVGLEDQLADQGLRRDLYYRLAGSVLEVPPLRRRRDDVSGLVSCFLRRYADEAGIRLRGVTAGAVRLLRAYDWPGNVRELEHEMQRLTYQAQDGGVIDVKNLDPRIRSPGSRLDVAPAELDSLELVPRLEALERALIREAMLRTGGRQVDAARLLGISRNGLAKKLKRLDLKEGWALEDRES